MNGSCIDSSRLKRSGTHASWAETGVLKAALVVCVVDDKVWCRTQTTWMGFWHEELWTSSLELFVKSRVKQTCQEGLTSKTLFIADAGKALNVWCLMLINLMSRSAVRVWHFKVLDLYCQNFLVSCVTGFGINLLHAEQIELWNNRECMHTLAFTDSVSVVM